MKKQLRWLLRQWYKFTSPSQGRMLWVHQAHGKFRVKYPDGRISAPFGWSTAKDYKDLFGGEIIDNF